MISRFTISVAVLLLLLAWGLVLNVNTGSVDIPTSDIFRMVWDALRYKVMNFFTGSYADELNAVITASPESRIIFSIRMPRMLLAAILGGALALSGRIEMPDRDAIRLLTASAESGICEARDLLMRLSSQGMLRSLVPDQQILQAGDLVPAGQVLGHESVGTLDYGAVHTEGVGSPGVVVAVTDEERPVAGDGESRER